MAGGKVISGLLRRRVRFVLAQRLLVVTTPFGTRLSTGLSNLQGRLPRDFAHPFRVGKDRTITTTCGFTLNINGQFHSRRSLAHRILRADHVHTFHRKFRHSRVRRSVSNPRYYTLFGELFHRFGDLKARLRRVHHGEPTI